MSNLDAVHSLFAEYEQKHPELFDPIEETRNNQPVNECRDLIPEIIELIPRHPTSFDHEHLCIHPRALTLVSNIAHGVFYTLSEGIPKVNLNSRIQFRNFRSLRKGFHTTSDPTLDWETLENLAEKDSYLIYGFQAEWKEEKTVAEIYIKEKSIWPLENRTYIYASELSQELLNQLIVHARQHPNPVQSSGTFGGILGGLLSKVTEEMSSAQSKDEVYEIWTQETLPEPDVGYAAKESVVFPRHKHWKLYDRYMLVTASNLPPKNVLLSDWLVWRLLKLAFTGEVQGRFFSQYWKADFDTKGWPIAGRRPKGTPAIVTANGKTGYVSVWGTYTLCGDDGYQALVRQGTPMAYKGDKTCATVYEQVKNGKMQAERLGISTMALAYQVSVLRGSVDLDRLDGLYQPQEWQLLPDHIRKQIMSWEQAGKPAGPCAERVTIPKAHKQPDDSAVLSKRPYTQRTSERHKRRKTEDSQLQTNSSPTASQSAINESDTVSTHDFLDSESDQQRFPASAVPSPRRLSFVLPHSIGSPRAPTFSPVTPSAAPITQQASNSNIQQPHILSSNVTELSAPNPDSALHVLQTSISGNHPPNTTTTAQPATVSQHSNMHTMKPPIPSIQQPLSTTTTAVQQSDASQTLAAQQAGMFGFRQSMEDLKDIDEFQAKTMSGVIASLSDALVRSEHNSEALRDALKFAIATAHAGSSYHAEARNRLMSRAIQAGPTTGTVLTDIDQRPPSTRWANLSILYRNLSVNSIWDAAVRPIYETAVTSLGYVFPGFGTREDFAPSVAGESEIEMVPEPVPTAYYDAACAPCEEMGIENCSTLDDHKAPCNGCRQSKVECVMACDVCFRKHQRRSKAHSRNVQPLPEGRDLNCESCFRPKMIPMVKSEDLVGNVILDSTAGTLTKV